MKYCSENIRSRMVAVYDFYMKNPGSTAPDLAIFLGIPKSSARSRTELMVRYGSVKESGVREVRGKTAQEFVAVKDCPPGSLEIESGQEPLGFKRQCVPAKQIGMRRDAWTAAFFGPAQAAACR